jgi:hypothetical protein
MLIDWGGTSSSVPFYFGTGVIPPLVAYSVSFSRYEENSVRTMKRLKTVVLELPVFNGF